MAGYMTAKAVFNRACQVTRDHGLVVTVADGDVEAVGKRVNGLNAVHILWLNLDG